MKVATARLYNWATLKANSTKAPLWIGLLFLLEIALLIPLDAVLMFFCLQNPRKTFLYILIAAIASTISAAVGYLLGHFLWDLIGPYIVPHFISTASFQHFASHLQLYENWAVLCGALLPFPLKALSITAGVFHLGLVPFLTCFAIGRLLRFTLVGGAMLLWGDKVKRFVERHFHRLVLLIGAKIALALGFFWVLAK